MAATASASPSSIGVMGKNKVGENMLSPHHHRSPSNYHGITALMLACQQGQVNDVQKIVRQRKQTIKERSRSGKTPLHFCAECGSVQCMDVILSMEPQLINAQDEDGLTPIHLAVINGNKDAVKRLVAAGADLNCLDNEKHSLVHWATVCGEVEMLDLLLSNGAPASTPDIHMAHPIHYAAQMCGSVNGVSGGSRARVQSTVHGVSPKRGLVILRKLIHHGCPVDVRDKDKREPLLWASSAAGVHFFRRRFEAQKLVHVPFMFKGSSDAILSLVNGGARVDAEDKDGLTALHCAASRGHTDCLETLIGLCGAEVDTIDNNGCTALFYAVTLGNADCTELLLNYGAEPNRQDRKGRTPAHCGAAKGQLETLKLLAKHEANLWLRNVRGDLPLHEAVLSRRKDLVMWLLSQRPDAVNASNNDGRCPLHLAALNNNVEMVKILIDHSADVNMLMRSGKGAPITPLDAAMHKGNSAVAKFLQLHGGLPSNSLNDSALQRRLNRSIDSHRSPGSSMQSQLGSHHDPSPEDPHRAFISPEAFDTSLVQFSPRADQAAPGDTKQGGSQGSNTGPFIATSTPIMDDSVQTDPSPSVRDTYVQVSDDLGLESSSTTSSHRKSERRRRRKSPREKSRSPSSSPDPKDRSKMSRASKKSSRKSSHKRSESLSQPSSNRQSEERDLAMEKRKSRSTSREKTGERESPSRKENTDGRNSSDALLDTTLVDEKFSELENVAVQSSETDAREEDLGSGEGTDDKDRRRRKRSKSKTPVVSEKEGDDKEDEEAKKKEEESTAEEAPAGNENLSRPESKKEQSILKSRNNSAKRTSVSWQDETGGKNKENEEEVGVVEAMMNEKESKTEIEEELSVVEAVADEKENKEEIEQEVDVAEAVVVGEEEGKENEKTESVVDAPEVKEEEIQDIKSELKDMTQKEEEKDEKVLEPIVDNSKLQIEPNQSSNGKADEIPERVENEVKAKAVEKDEDYLDEIEKGKTINLQEAAAARRRSQSKSVSRERSVDLSDASSRSAHKHCFDKNNHGKKLKPGGVNKTSSSSTNLARSPSKNKSGSPARKIPSTSEEREIFLQEQILAGKRLTASSQRGRGAGPGGGSRRSSRGDETGGEFRDSGYSDQTLMMNTSASEEHRRKGTKTSSSVSMKRRYQSSRRPGSSSHNAPNSMPTNIKRKSIFSSSAKKVKPPRDRTRFNNSVTVNQLMMQQQHEHEMMMLAAAQGMDRDGDDSTSTRGDSITSGDDYMDPAVGDRRTRRKTGMTRPRSKLGFGREEQVESRLSPRIAKKCMDVDTPISVTQAMQASMRKYNLERAIFQQLLELKRLQIRAGKANEQLLVKRLADGYKKNGLAVNYREYSGPYTFKNFEKYLYDQLRLLQANRKIIPRFAPSDDLERLSGALKKMNATKLPFLEDEDRSASCCSHNGDVNGAQCTHSTHRCHHAAHAYTGVPCAAYIGKGRKPTFLPKVNPLRAPGPTQNDPTTRTSVMRGLIDGTPTPTKTVSPMQIAISPRNDTQSPITLEVQQGQSTQVFTLPTQTLDPTKNYYVSLSIKPTSNVMNANNDNGATTAATANKFNFHNNNNGNNHIGANTVSTSSLPRNNPGDLIDDGSISAPPPPAENDPDLNIHDVDRDKHNQSL